jgi:hypothetical protein
MKMLTWQFSHKHSLGPKFTKWQELLDDPYDFNQFILFGDVWPTEYCPI